MNSQLEQEKQDFGKDLENKIDGFTTERFNTLITPEKKTDTAQIIFEGNNYSESSSSRGFGRESYHM